MSHSMVNAAVSNGSSCHTVDHDMHFSGRAMIDFKLTRIFISLMLLLMMLMLTATCATIVASTGHGSEWHAW